MGNIEQIRELEKDMGLEPLGLTDIDTDDYLDWLIEGSKPINTEQAWERA